MTLLASPRATLLGTLTVALVLVLPAAHAPATNADTDFAAQIARLKAAHDPVNVLLASAAIGGWEPSPQDLAWRAPPIDINDPAPLVSALLELDASSTATTDAQLHAPLPSTVTSTITQTYANVPLAAQRAVTPIVLTVAHASMLVNQALAQVSPQEQAAFGLNVLHLEKQREARLRAAGIPLDKIDAHDDARERLLEAWATLTPPPLTDTQVASITDRIDLTKMVLASALITRQSLDAAPKIRATVDAGQWPLQQIADPIGLLDLGSAGNDRHSGVRWIIIDPAGDDLYYESNAGGTGPNLVPYVIAGPWNIPRIPASLALDLAGNDTYNECASNSDVDVACQGSGELGVGILLDLGRSRDTYKTSLGDGAASGGIGLLYDDGGDDSYSAGRGEGYSSAGLGVAYDAAGNDSYWGLFSQGFADVGVTSTVSGAVGVLKDDGGRDTYAPGPPAGWPRDNEGSSYSPTGKGILLDQGGEPDSYAQPYAHDNGHWEVGENGGTGYGNDS